jgi:hypothetical protein
MVPRVRATAFAFATSVGRFIGAGVNFLLAGMVLRMGTLGVPVALTAVAFGFGLLIIPSPLRRKARDCRNDGRPEGIDPSPFPTRA